jgi:hypothetical protein
MLVILIVFSLLVYYFLHCIVYYETHFQIKLIRVLFHY